MKAQHQKTMLNADFPLDVFFTDVTEFPPHWHSVVELVYIPDGSLRIGVNSEVYTMHSRDILLVNSGDVHYFVPQPKQVNRLILHFETSYFESVFPALKNKRFSKIHLSGYSHPAQAGIPYADTSISVHKILEEQITALIKENDEKRDAYKIALKARLFDILVILLRFLPMQQYSLQDRSRHLDRLGRLEIVFRYVENHYCSGITLKEIAAVANFSEYYFSRFFKEATGMTFGKYVNNYRVEKAVQLLRNSDDSITEIAFKSGFESIKTFNRVFKQTKNCSPSLCRKTISEV